MATKISFKQLGENIINIVGLEIFTSIDNITKWSTPIDIDGNVVVLKNMNSLMENQKISIKTIHIIENNELAGIAIVNSYDEANDKFNITALKYGTGGSAAGDAFLEEDIVSNTQVGGINSNVTLSKGTSFTNFVKQLLVKDMLPSLSFSLIGEGLYEKGSSVNNVELILSITSFGNIKIKNIEFYDGGVLLATENYIEGEKKYSFSIEDEITTNKNYKVVVSYEDAKYKDSIFSKNINFVGMSYYGIVNDLNIDSSIIESLNQTLKNNKNYTYNNISMVDKRICYAYPTIFGELKSIKDDNNFDYLGSYTKTIQVVNNEDYNVYVLTDPVTVNNFKQIYN